jgi:hypothetical protein
MQKELPNGQTNRWLAGGELRWAIVGRRHASPVGTRCSAAPLSRVRLTCGAVGLKLTWATVPLGRAQIIKPNVFSIFQTNLNL